MQIEQFRLLVLQTAWKIDKFNDYKVVRGDIAAAKFALFHLAEDGTVKAVEAVNAPQEFMGGRRIVQRGKRLTAEQIQDMANTMQSLAS